MSLIFQEKVHPPPEKILAMPISLVFIINRTASTEGYLKTHNFLSQISPHFKQVDKKLNKGLPRLKQIFAKPVRVAALMTESVFSTKRNTLHIRITFWLSLRNLCFFGGGGATTAEKLRGTKVWVPTPGRLRFAPGQRPDWVFGPPAVRVRGYHARKICENLDAKSYILVTTCCEISCFLKTTAKKLGDQYNTVFPGPYGCRAHVWGEVRTTNNVELGR